MTMPRAFLLSLVLALTGASCLEGQPGRRSQAGSVTQQVGRANVEVIYRRPVARGRGLFGSLVKWGVVWTPSADSAALFRTSSDLEINGQQLKAGRYAIWMIPDSTTWTVIFTSKPAFHLTLPEPGEEVLRIRTKPGNAEHMETLGFYFPMVDGDSAVLNMHWGRTVVPLRLKAR